MGTLIDLKDKVFGRWSVLRKDSSSRYSNGSVFWICECICGTIKSVSGKSFGYKEQSKNQAKFARKYGLNPQYINKYLTGLRKKDVKGWVFRYV